MSLSIPFDERAEREVVGCAVGTDIGYRIAVALACPADFYTPRYGRLFAACAGMADVPTTWNDEERVTQAAMAAEVDAREVWRLVDDRSRHQDVHGEFARLVAKAAHERRAMAAAAELYNAIAGGAAVEDALAHLRPFLEEMPWAA